PALQGSAKDRARMPLRRRHTSLPGAETARTSLGAFLGQVWDALARRSTATRKRRVGQRREPGEKGDPCGKCWGPRATRDERWHRECRPRHPLHVQLLEPALLSGRHAM